MTTFTATSLLGEALHIGFQRLTALLQREFEHPEAITTAKVAQSLGFASWADLRDRAIRTTARQIDPRLELLVERHLDDDLASRLAAAFDTTTARTRGVLGELRDPDQALAEQGCC